MRNSYKYKKNLVELEYYQLLFNSKTHERVKAIEINIIINFKNDTNYDITKNTTKNLLEDYSLRTLTSLRSIYFHLIGIILS